MILSKLSWQKKAGHLFQDDRPL